MLNIFFFFTALSFTLHMQGVIILINGTSCAGKSSTVHVLQRHFQEQNTPTHSSSIDDAFPIIVSSLDTIKNHIPKTVAQAPAINSATLVWALWHEEIVRKQAENPQTPIIVDHCLNYPPYFHTLLSVWDKESHPDLFFVKLYCTKEVALERLALRNQSLNKAHHRNPDCLNAHFNPIVQQRLHGNKIYDLELDSSNKTAEECGYHLINTFKNSTYNSIKDSYLLPSNQQGLAEYNNAHHALVKEVQKNILSSQGATLFSSTWK